MKTIKTSIVLAALVLTSGYFILPGHKNAEGRPFDLRDAVGARSGGVLGALNASLGDPGAAVPAPAAAMADEQVGKYLREIAAKFDWYGKAELKPGLTDAQLAQAVVEGIKRGTCDTVVFGESHGNLHEQNSALLIMKRILDDGIPVGAFTQESTQQQKVGGTKTPLGIFTDVSQLTQARVPVLFMQNHFNPDKDIKTALKAAGAKLLITYTGTAHTSVRMRDYILNTLKVTDMGWNNAYPGRPVIEQVLQRHDRKPVVIAMNEEESVFNQILSLQLKEASTNVSYEQLQTNLQALRAAWEQTVGAFQSPSGIRYVQAAEQPNFYVGIAAGERRPMGLEAVLKVAQLPEFRQWLGGKTVQSAYAGKYSASACSPGIACCLLGYSVSMQSNGQTFDKNVCATDL